jgi:type IV/VI secretion system ImpK/VasF family protein
MTLEVLYQTVFATIVRIQSGTQKAATAEELRTSLLSYLDEVDQVLRRSAGAYTPEQLEAARFAVVAFTDEAALRAPQTRIRDQWVSKTQKSLSHELFGETNSGEAFYKRLEKIRGLGSLSAETIDVLEVYCVCLLLGFEGAYTDRSVLINELVRDIQHVRGKAPALSFGNSNLSQTVSPTPDRPVRWMHRLAFAVAAVTLFLYAMAQWNLRSWTGNIVEQASGTSPVSDRN